jgi:hypothetical protein
MVSPQPGTARALVYAVLEKLGPGASIGDIAGVAGTQQFAYANIAQAVVVGVSAGDIERTGQRGSYRYTLRTNAAEGDAHATAAAPPPVAKGAPHAAVGADLAPGVGTRCAVSAPENRAQGTIAQALRAVMSVDAPLPLNEIFMALPMGWSRTEALAGLKEAALDGWVNFDNDGWTLVGDPPEPRAADPLVIADMPSHVRLRLEEIRGSLNELLRDAIQLHDQPVLIRALANAYAETDSALTHLRS